MKKKLLSLALCLCMVLSLLPGMALAADYTLDNVNWSTLVADTDTVTIDGKTYTYKGDATEAVADFATPVGVGGCKPLAGDCIWKASEGYILYSYTVGGSSAAVTLCSATGVKNINLPYNRGSGSDAPPPTGCDTVVTLEGTSTLSGCLTHNAGSTTFTGGGTLNLTKNIACWLEGSVTIENGAQVTLGDGTDGKSGYFYQPLTVKSGATLTVAAGATLYSGSSSKPSDNPGGVTVEDGGTLENNGAIYMITKSTGNLGITGDLTGTGVVYFGNDITPYTKVGNEWLASGGDNSSEALDLSTAPAVKTVYKAGETGTILWEPTLTGANVTGGTLTFTGASMGVSSDDTLVAKAAVTLPNLTGGVKVVFNGTNSITANNYGSAYAFKCMGSTIFALSAGSNTTLSASGQNASAITNSFDYVSTDATIEITGTGKLTVTTTANSGTGSYAISATDHSVSLTGGVLDFTGFVDGKVTLGGITVPVLNDAKLDLSYAASVSKGDKGAANSGTIILPSSFNTIEKFAALNISGGTVKVGSTSFIKLGTEWLAYGRLVPETGLDLNVPPAVKTLYTAGTGTILW